jgi:predicted outer membrane repeat protein/parallel beta-helix repeat protein
MRTLSFTLCLIALAAAAWASPTHIPAGNVQGNWTEANSPYIIDGDVVVPTGETLKIGPRVRVEFAGHYKFTVNGTLLAEAKDGDRIKTSKDDKNAIWFTTDLSTNPDGWAGLRFVNATGCKLDYCIIENGRASGGESDNHGGGMYFENSNGGYANCTIRNNTAAGKGGGVAVFNSRPAFANCTISGNSAADMGGGFYAEKGKPTIANATISGNSAAAQGGGLAAVNESTVRVANCSFSNNKSAVQGGGIYTVGSMVDMANASLSDNEKGGAAIVQGSTVRLTNCSVHGNTAMERGGGVLCSGSTMTLTNASVNGNEQGGVYLADASKADMTNCSIRGNGEKSVDKDATSQANMTNCSVKN